MTSTSNRRKKIVFGTTVGLSAGTLLRGQLAWFRNQGWDVTLVSTPDEEAKQSAHREGVSLIGINMKREIDLLSDLRAAFSWLIALRKLRPNVINLGTPKASLLGMAAAWVCRVPRRIYTVRGLRLEGTQGFLTKLLWLMERLTISMATDVIIVSPSLGKAMVHRRLVSSDNLWIIGEGSSNGVPASAIQKRVSQVDRAVLREELEIDPSKFVVGFIGRLTKEKGVETLLDVLENKNLNENVQLLLIGSSEGASLPEVGRRSNRIVTVPWTNDVWGLLPAIDVLCLPTLREGFPNVVIEAAAAGIPSITTRATGAIDSVVEGETGFLIEVNDTDLLVDRINSLVNKPKLLQRLSRNAVMRVEQSFIPERVWEGVESIAKGSPALGHVNSLNQYLGNVK